MRAVRKRRPHLSSSERMRAFGVNKKRYLAAIPLLILLITLVAYLKAVPLIVTRFQPAPSTAVNPLMGWAPDAETEPGSSEAAHALVYARLTWKELEPEPGVYDFDAFEQRIHLKAWRALGKRLVLRFVLDAPGDSPHRDIPDWLAQQMGGDAGVAYENARGAGFSPNYSNLLLMSRHAQALNALGARYDASGDLAFVELGSLGHDGDWTVETGLGDYGMPPASDLKSWIWHYKNAFEETPLLAPAPCLPVKLADLGLYNDQIGDEAATWDWLDKVEYGGYDAATGAELRAMGDALTHKATGAALGSGVDIDNLFTSDYPSFLRRLSACSVTYIAGVRCANLSAWEKLGMNGALARIGYRLWIREVSHPASVRAGYRLSVGLSFQNDGAQPFSRDWPFELSLLQNGKVCFRAVTDLDLRTLAPGRTRTTVRVDVPGGLTGRYQIAAAILDPVTLEPAVELPMRAPRADLRAILGELTVTR